MKDYLAEDKDYDLWMLLAQTHHLVAKLRDKEVSQYGISREQAFILFIIQALGNKATPANISRHTVLQLNTISEIINRMVKNGLVTKTKESEGRTRIKVKFTEKGQWAYYQSVKRESMHSIMTALSEEKRQQLQLCLEILRDSALKQLAPAQESHELLIPPSRLMSNLNLEAASEDSD